MTRYVASKNLGDVFGRSRDPWACPDPSGGSNEASVSPPEPDLSKLWDAPPDVSEYFPSKIVKTTTRHDRALDALAERWNISDDEDVWFLAMDRNWFRRALWVVTLIACVVYPFQATWAPGDGKPYVAVIMMSMMLIMMTMLFVYKVRVESPRSIRFMGWSREIKGNVFDVAPYFSVKQIEFGIWRHRKVRDLFSRRVYEEEVFEAVEGKPDPKVSLEEQLRSWE